jgi:hypothetical protein
MHNAFTNKKCTVVNRLLKIPKSTSSKLHGSSSKFMSNCVTIPSYYFLISRMQVAESLSFLFRLLFPNVVALYAHIE